MLSSDQKRLTTYTVRVYFEASIQSLKRRENLDELKYKQEEEVKGREILDYTNFNYYSLRCALKGSDGKRSVGRLTSHDVCGPTCPGGTQIPTLVSVVDYFYD